VIQLEWNIEKMKPYKTCGGLLKKQGALRKLLTICRFFSCPTSAGRNSKSLSPRYKARRVSARKT
jgi:hypothetical protein